MSVQPLSSVVKSWALDVGVHQRVRKPHLGSVDGAIASTLDNGKNVAILGVKDYLFDVSLYTQMCQLGRARVWGAFSQGLWRCCGRTLRLSRAVLDIVPRLKTGFAGKVDG